MAVWMGDAERWMAEARAEAERGLGRTAPNPAVGCVIVKNGRVVGRGFHRRAGLPHAEIEALAEARGRARGAIVYVTLEPCSHTGRTPPCSEALIEAGVAGVVAGCRDPNPLVSGKGLGRLRRAGLRCAEGVQRQACEELIRGFRCWTTQHRPWVEVKLAASLDGRIATRNGASKWISGRDSRRLVHRMRARADALLVGVGTVLADDPRLTCRAPGGGRHPLRVVLDEGLRTPPSARLVCGPGRCLIVAGERPPSRRRARLESAGAEVLSMGTRGRRGWLRLLRELAGRDVLELMIEGGAGVAASALKARVVNQLTIFYNPRLIGGDGVPLVAGLGVVDPRRASRWRTLDLGRSGSDILWRGRPESSAKG